MSQFSLFRCAMRVATIVLPLSAMAACADVTAIRVTDANPNVSGIPINAPMPVVVVQGGTMSIQYIPNPSEKYALRMRAFFAKNDSVVDIRPNGTVSKVDALLDSSAALEPLLEFAKAALKPPLTSGQPEREAVFGGGVNGVYAFVFDADGTPIGLRKLGIVASGERRTAAEVAHMIAQAEKRQAKAIGGGTAISNE